VILDDRMLVLHRLWQSVSRGLMDLTKDVMHEHGLPVPAMAVMHHLFHSPARVLAVSELSKRTGMAKSLVSKTVDSLEAMELVVKRKDLVDRRRVLVEVSERAQEQFQNMQRHMQVRLAVVFARLPEAQIQELISGLEAVERAIAATRAEHRKGDQLS
jgi:DNA-binding MarR family transcriptional regulator